MREAHALQWIVSFRWIGLPVEALEARFTALQRDAHGGYAAGVRETRGVDNVITVGYADKDRNNILVTINGTAGRTIAADPVEKRPNLRRHRKRSNPRSTDR